MSRPVISLALAFGLGLLTGCTSNHPAPQNALDTPPRVENVRLESMRGATGRYSTGDGFSSSYYELNSNGTFVGGSSTDNLLVVQSEADTPKARPQNDQHHEGTWTLVGLEFAETEWKGSDGRTHRATLQFIALDNKLALVDVDRLHLVPAKVISWPDTIYIYRKEESALPSKGL